MSIRAISATLARLGDFCSGSSTRWKVKRTASALKGSPSWKTTPLRSLSWRVTSSTKRQDSASWGTMRFSASRPTSESNMLTPTMARKEDRFMVGSRFSGVQGMATRSSPWGWASARFVHRVRSATSKMTTRRLAFPLIISALASPLEASGQLERRPSTPSGARGSADETRSPSDSPNRGFEVFVGGGEREDAAGSDDHTRASALAHGILGLRRHGRGRSFEQNVLLAEAADGRSAEPLERLAQRRLREPIVPVDGCYRECRLLVEVDALAVHVEHGPHGATLEAVEHPARIGHGELGVIHL